MTKKNQKIAKDSLGKIFLPKNVYYGTTTQRALNNFQISNITAPSVFREALGIIKLTASETNTKLKKLTPTQNKAIQQACKEFIQGNFNNDFILDIFQAGAGTSYNMNANEIIANRANELLKNKTNKIHPNDHINASQSTNDVIPTATKIAILFTLPPLMQELHLLIKEFKEKNKSFKNILKVGRTHFQDAVPISLEQEFDSYKKALENSFNFIQETSQQMHILGIGGTAVGTGINTHPKYKETIIKELIKLTGIKFKSAENLTETANNMNSFLNFSSALNSLAINIINISRDLKIMNTGPKAGLNEIKLPAVQPGSSIMPGKINPSILECADMIAMEVQGNTETIKLATQNSSFELNVYCPIIMYKLLQSMKILTNGLKMIRELAIKNLEVNKKQIKYLLENSLCTATALVPKLGYDLTTKIVKKALEKNITIKSILLKEKLLTEKEINKLLSSSA